MTAARSILIALFLPLLGACNMVISETPMFADAERAASLPRDGIWLSEDKDCVFDSGEPESTWPTCVMWILVRDGGTDISLSDGKGQSESIHGLVVAGNPMIVQARWIDTAKEPSRAIYGYYAIEPLKVDTDRRFSEAKLWPVECGLKKGADAKIEPFPGIGPGCRPTSQDSIRSAATSSSRGDELSEWRWLRAEATAKRN